MPVKLFDAKRLNKNCYNLREKINNAFYKDIEKHLKAYKKDGNVAISKLRRKYGKTSHDVSYAFKTMAEVQLEKECNESKSWE